MTFRKQCREVLAQYGLVSTEELVRQVGCSHRTAQEMIQEYKQKQPKGYVAPKGENLDTPSVPYKETMGKDTKKIEPSLNESFIANKPYYYDDSNDTYVIHLKSVSVKKPLIISGDIIKNMKRKYSNWDGQESTINEVGRDFGFSRSQFIEIKTKLGWTHDSEPFTDEEIIERDEDDLVNEALQNKKLAVFTKFEQKKWHKIKKDAEKWNEFETQRLMPWTDVVASPLKYKPQNIKRKPIEGNQSLVLVLADGHCGAGYDSNSLLSNNVFSIEEYKRRMEVITSALKDKYNKGSFENIYVMDLGESFDSNQNQTTDKGTPRRQSHTIEEVWKAITSSNGDLIHNIYPLAQNKLIKHSVVGNHFSFGDLAAEEWLKATFNNFPNIEINPNMKIADSITIGDSQFVITHGKGLSNASSSFSSKNENNITTMLMQWFKKDFQDTKYRYVLAGHVHHKYMAEKSNFTFYSCPSIMGDDTYAESLFLVSRPAATYFIIDDKTGISSQHYIYF